MKQKFFRRRRTLRLLSLLSLLLSCVLIAGSVPVSAASRYGSRGDEVRQIQNRLNQLGYNCGTADGIFGTRTRDAVRRFQADNGLTVDGIVGTKTMAALGLSGGIFLRNGSSGTTVRTVQEKLKNWGYYTGSVDGQFGSQTEAAVKQFQSANGLTVDGVVGPRTFAALGMSSYVNSSNSSSNYDRDVSLLARIISAEARGEPYRGQVAVGAVIMNRVKHPSFPNTLSGVIYQEGAFTAIVDGQFNEPVADSAYRAAREALAGVDPTNGCIYYYNPATATSSWIFSLPVNMVIGNHVFSRGK